MSANRRARRRPPERGFVLVGVVMMVLALTIIGVSLFGLSGYESQFFGRTLQDRQALYTASGGVELAKELLVTPLGSPASRSLSNVKLAIGREDIVSAVAWYADPFDSTGPLRPNEIVNVRIGVNVRGTVRTIQGSYHMGQPNSPYWRLFAATTSILYNGGPTGTLRVSGGAWQPVQASSDTAWIGSLEGESSVAMTGEAVPSPLSAPFITAHFPPPNVDTAWVSRDYNLASPFPHYANVYIDMDAGTAPDAYKYFRAASDSLAPAQSLIPKFDFYSGAIVHVRVRGTAVWVIPAGAYFGGEFRVERLPNTNTANLVIVAGPNGRYAAFPTAGAMFDKGIWTPNNDVNVFVVSHGTVQIHDASTSPQTVETRNLCVYADAIQLGGPASGTHRLDLRYPPALKQVADHLYGRGLLPAVSGMQSSTFALEPGTWTTSPGLQ